MTRISLLFILILLATPTLRAQNLQHIKVKKAETPFLFFQKNNVNDTISPKKSDLFYLLMSDSLKNQIIIESQNAQLMQQTGDSLVLLKYLPGINYLHKFVLGEEVLNSGENVPLKKTKKEHLVLITMIDGASTLEKNKIKIVFRNKNNKTIFAEFNYQAY